MGGGTETDSGNIFHEEEVVISLYLSWLAGDRNW